MILHLKDEIQACGSFFNWHELLVTYQNTKILFNLIGVGLGSCMGGFIVSPKWLLQWKVLEWQFTILSKLAFLS